MKKMSVVVIALSLAVSMFGVAHAGYRNGMGGGCVNCPQAGATSEQFRKFRSDTIDLRQEMMNKRFEMQRENLKAAPDKGRIAALQADIRGIQAKIMDICGRSGLPVNRCDGECGPGMGGPGKSGCDVCGKGMGRCCCVPNSQK